MTTAAKRVMFVCRKNSARSQMAEGFAKMLGAGKVQVVSSGLEASVVRPEAVVAMQAVGIDISQQTSDALCNFNPAEFYGVISLCGCGTTLPQDWKERPYFDEWDLVDPAEQPELFPAVRDQIQQRVKALIQTL